MNELWHIFGSQMCDWLRWWLMMMTMLEYDDEYVFPPSRCGVYHPQRDLLLLHNGLHIFACSLFQNAKHLRARCSNDSWVGRFKVKSHKKGNFTLYLTQVWSLPCTCWICQSFYMDFSKLLYWCVKIDTWTSPSCYMDISKLIVFTWIYRNWYILLVVRCIFS